MMQPLSNFELAIVVLSLALATFVTRAGLLLAGERLRLSHRLATALRFAPACALAALVLPEIVYRAGAIDLSLDNPKWPAALIAAGFLLWRSSIVGCIVIGMAVYAAIRVW
jgi:branched-subunit amino acid transport protein